MKPPRPLLLFAAVAGPTTAMRLGRRDAPAAPASPAQVQPQPPQITAAPSDAALELRLGRRADGTPCVSSCINAAITRSTNCKPNDWTCGCASTNVYLIRFGADSCVAGCVGYVSAER